MPPKKEALSVDSSSTSSGVLKSFRALKKDTLRSGKKGKRTADNPSPGPDAGENSAVDSDEEQFSIERCDDVEPKEVFDKGETLLNKLLVSHIKPCSSLTRSGVM